MGSTLPQADDEPGMSGTRAALIAAAADVFAEVGFHHARVREICLRAGANVAAVNYHFGDKERLYAEVMREAFGRITREYPLEAATGPATAPEERLRAFVHAYFRRLFAAGSDSRHSRLILREMIEPTLVLDQMIELVVRPTGRLLDDILRGLLGPDAPEPVLKRCAMSVIGQAVFYVHCDPVIRRAFPALRMDRQQLDTLADHVAMFSLAGVRAMKPSAKPKSKRGARRTG